MLLAAGAGQDNHSAFPVNVRLLVAVARSKADIPVSASTRHSVARIESPTRVGMRPIARLPLGFDPCWQTVSVVALAAGYTTSHNRAVSAFNRAISVRSSRASALRLP
jgi:hypothetical protein